MTQRGHLSDIWESPETMPPLGEGQIQVWWRDVVGADRDAAWAVLNDAERARAERMRAGTSREELVVARGTLRMLLARCLGREAASLEFAVSGMGKPYLVGGGMEFSVSHSRGTVLIALSKETEVGVDLEKIGNIEEVDIADRHFHEEEAKFLRDLPESELRRRAFFAIWTMKEAVVKADGRGLSVPLQMFSVADYVAQQTWDVPGTRYGEVCVSTGDERVFSVRALAVQDGFAGALAATRPDLELGCFEYAAFSNNPVVGRRTS